DSLVVVHLRHPAAVAVAADRHRPLDRAAATMTRRTRLNIALAVIAIMLAGWLWLSRTTPPAQPQPLLPIARQDINRIEIRAADAKTVVLGRQQGHWRLLEPVNARANANSIDNLLAIAAMAPRQ